MSNWASNRASEVDFWQRWMNSDGLIWPDEFVRRQRADEPLQSDIANLLDPSIDRYLVLDVGAGPLTALGKVVPGKELEIVAVDPLASDYDAMLAKRGIAPIVHTQYARGEELPFEDNSFDLVHMMNALDHSDDPVSVMREMLRVARPGAAVYLSHATMEGRRNGYSGLHQWDLFIDALGHLCLTAFGALCPIDLTLMKGAGAVSVLSNSDAWHVITVRKT